MEKAAQAKKRIHFLDELRGFAVLCMIFYHAFYIIGSFFGAEWANNFFEFFMPVQPFFAGIFIFLCGVSCSLSKNNLKRGAILLAIALGMTLVTAVIMPKLGFFDCEIYFGILHFLSVSIIIYAFLSKSVSKLSPFAGILLCAVLYAFTSGIGSGKLEYGELLTLNIPDNLYQSNILMPFGIYSVSFYSADYFPLLPNIFIFFAGVFAGIHFTKTGYHEQFYKRRIPFFAFLGKKALIIYVIHMPVIYAIAYGIEFIIKN